MEPISKSGVHYLARTVSSMVRVASKLRYRGCIAVDETKLSVKSVHVYVWSAVDVDSGELLAIDVSYGRSCLNAIIFLKKALKLCSNKPLVIVDRGPWYRWALDRLGLEYRVERFFRYLKERTAVFYHKLSARNHIQGIKNLNLYTIYYQIIKMEDE